MQLNGIAGFVNRICEWITSLAYVNLLWILFTLFGLVIFGLMPATASLFSVVSKWIDVRVFKTFWENYRKSFFKINLIGLILLVIGYALHLDSVFARNIGGSLSMILSTVLVIVSVIYLLMIIYIFPIFAHFELTIIQYFKYTLIFAISNLVGTIAMVLGGIGIYLISMKLPVMFLFFSVSLLSFLFMWLTSLTFRKIQTQNTKNIITQKAG